MIADGTLAPDFTLPDQNGTPVTLSALRGGRTLLVFYAKDGSEGCDRELAEFDALLPSFAAAGITVLAISPDTAERHAAHARRKSLGLTLLADPEAGAISAYGLWQKKQMFGRHYMGVVRATFLISQAGTVARGWKVRRVAGHAAAVLGAALKAGPKT